MAAVRFYGTTLLACVLAALVPATATGGPRRAHIPLPAELTGTQDGVPYRIVVPGNWNGTLLLWAHGTRLRAVGGPVVPDVAPTPFPAPSPTLEQQLLADGYALAGSEYANSLEAGVEATHALTRHFYRAVGRPSRVMVWGCSLGGGVTTLLREKYPFTYDGAISCAGVVSDPELAGDASLAFGLAYDVTFGWPSDKWGLLEDVRDDLTFFGDVVPILSPQIMNPANKAKWEFVRLVMKLPVEAFWMPDPQTTLFVALAMWKATEQRANAEAGAGGVTVQNRNHVYTLTAQDKAYLASLGLTNAEELLAQMNARTNIDADHSARVQVEIWSADGNLRRPLITLHSAYDGLARTEIEGLYLEKVRKSHDLEQLVQVFTAMPGHCSFSTQQYLAVLAAMERWLDTGDKPEPAAFPATLGFAPGYVPAPWPFPEPRCRHQWPWHRHDRWGNCLR